MVAPSEKLRPLRGLFCWWRFSIKLVSCPEIFQELPIRLPSLTILRKQLFLNVFLLLGVDGAAVNIEYIFTEPKIYVGQCPGDPKYFQIFLGQHPSGLLFNRYISA